MIWNLITVRRHVGSFPLVPRPSLLDIYYLHRPDAYAIFVHGDLLCNSACSVIENTQTENQRGKTEESFQERE